MEEKQVGKSVKIKITENETIAHVKKIIKKLKRDFLCLDLIKKASKQKRETPIDITTTAAHTLKIYIVMNKP
ncbi:MAG: hypothetical protein ACTTHG_04380 [Treponemataceae bacterium]